MEIIHPILLYVLLTLGGLGMVWALPRKGVSPQIIGGVLGTLGLGGVLVASGLYAAEREVGAGVWFYVFAFIAIASAIRVISHPRPVYAALYFILTILSSSAIYLLLGAEFMAFALIIIYAGAILITYLFVIMLATQAPTEEQEDRLSAYDAYAREPVLAVVMGFILLAGLSGLFRSGVNEMMPPGVAQGEAFLADVPGRVIDALDRRGAFRDGRFKKPTHEEVAAQRENLGRKVVDLEVADATAIREGFAKSTRFAELFSGEQRSQVGLPPAGDSQRDLLPTPAESASGVEPTGGQRTMTVALPPDLRVENIDHVGWKLVAAHPMGLELAGVILTMAMLGAIVLARKQIELTEDEKEERARTLAADMQGGVA